MGFLITHTPRWGITGPPTDFVTTVVPGGTTLPPWRVRGLDCSRQPCGIYLDFWEGSNHLSQQRRLEVS